MNNIRMSLTSQLREQNLISDHDEFNFLFIPYSNTIRMFFIRMSLIRNSNLFGYSYSISAFFFVVFVISSFEYKSEIFNCIRIFVIRLDRNIATSAAQRFRVEKRAENNSSHIYEQRMANIWNWTPMISLITLIFVSHLPYRPF